MGYANGIGSALRAAFRLVSILVLTLFVTVILTLMVLVGAPGQQPLRRGFYRAACWLAGLEIERRGAIADHRPCLFVANHASYLDIAVLGAMIDASFVSRADVARWPLIGWSARVQGTVFIERAARQARRHLEGVVARLRQGENLVLFPEGTSSDGQRVLPFKSTLFAAVELTAEDLPVQVQPVSVAYTKLDGVPMGRYLRPFFAWYGDMQFWSHLWQLLSLGRATVVVSFHEAVQLQSFGNRKLLSDHCHKQVSLGVATALSGHRQGDRGAEVPAIA